MKTVNKGNITKKIINILERNDPVPGDTISDKLAYRYLDAGHIDSLSIINFIIELEEIFNITLSPEDTQSDDFRFISGLATMIDNKINE
jgi:acyl carrier protein